MRPPDRLSPARFSPQLQSSAAAARRELPFRAWSETTAALRSPLVTPRLRNALVLRPVRKTPRSAHILRDERVR